VYGHQSNMFCGGHTVTKNKTVAALLVQNSQLINGY